MFFVLALAGCANETKPRADYPAASGYGGSPAFGSARTRTIARGEPIPADDQLDGADGPAGVRRSGTAAARSGPSSAMVAHFIDAGQADCTLLEFPCAAVLIDAGSQDAEATSRVIAYLDSFFSSRPDLDRTFEAVYITHPHIDHTRLLDTLSSSFRIKRFIDGGADVGSGGGFTKRLRQRAGGLGITLRPVTHDEISPPNGLTDADIDPVNCPGADPTIRLLGARRLDKPDGWSNEEFDNQNNHSLVLRVDLGGSSLLVTGDLEDQAIETILHEYDGTDAFDVDVYHVGHHGSNNGTTKALMDAMTPDVAVISMGHWTFDREGGNRFSTWFYGHPRRAVIELLVSGIVRTRSNPVRVTVFDKPRTPSEITVRRAVYATGWDGTIRLRASASGTLRASTEHR